MPTLLQRFGDVDFPIDASDVSDNQLFSALEPGRDQLLSLFQTAINEELNRSQTYSATSPWGTAATGTKLESKLPVADTTYRIISRAPLREREVTFPLLALYRTTFESDEWTLSIDRITQDWGLDYILGPLDEADYRRLGGALVAVPKFIGAVIRKQGHPAFESGAVQFGAGKGHFSTVKLASGIEGPASWGQTGEGHEFWACSMVLQTTELESLTADGGDFEGATVKLGVGNATEAVPELVVGRTEVPVQSPIGDTNP